MYHAEATGDDSIPQPGYSYAVTTLKSLPLSNLDVIERLSNKLADLCGVDKWNIGVNPICYRGKSDKMGKHADNDQGEEIITTAIISQDSPRLLVFEPSPKKFPKDKLQTGEEKIVLLLRQGDVYQMDGALQKDYVHSVPPCKNSNSDGHGNEKDRRLAIVFRKGKRVDYLKDNGEPVSDLKPPPKLEYRFGAIEGLHYGGLYKRSELFDLRAHQAAQRSISGSIHAGCDALTMSGTREEGLEWDGFLMFVYAVESRKGAGALVTSYNRGKCVRVFRTNQIDPAIKRGHSATQLYRYDGLYRISSYETPDDPKKPFLFFMQMSNFSVSGENGVDGRVPFPGVDFIPNKPPFLVNMGAERITRGLFQQAFTEAKDSTKDPNSVTDILVALDHLFELRVESSRETHTSTVNGAKVRCGLPKKNSFGAESQLLSTRYTKFRLWNNSVACTREETLPRQVRISRATRGQSEIQSLVTLSKKALKKRPRATRPPKDSQRVTRSHPLVESSATLKDESWEDLQQKILVYALEQGMSLEDGKIILEATLPSLLENHRPSRSSQQDRSKEKCRLFHRDLNDKDILSGRGIKKNRPVHRAYRRLVSLNQPFYQTRIDSAMKERCIDALIGFLESRQVRFLETISDSEYAQISHERCVDKLRKALSEKRPYKETRTELLSSVLEDIKQNRTMTTRETTCIEDHASLKPLRIFCEPGSSDLEPKGIQLHEKIENHINLADIRRPPWSRVQGPCFLVHMWPYSERRILSTAEERCAQVLCRWSIDHPHLLHRCSKDWLLGHWLVDLHFSPPIIFTPTQLWLTFLNPLGRFGVVAGERFVSVASENQWAALNMLRDMSLEADVQYSFEMATRLNNLLKAATGLSGRQSEVAVAPALVVDNDDKLSIFESAFDQVEPINRCQNPLLPAADFYTTDGTHNHNPDQVQISLYHERVYENLKLQQTKKEEALTFRGKVRSGAMSQTLNSKGLRAKKHADLLNTSACSEALARPVISVKTEDYNTIRYGVSRTNVIGSETQHVMTRHAKVRLESKQPVRPKQLKKRSSALHLTSPVQLKRGRTVLAKRTRDMDKIKIPEWQGQLDISVPVIQDAIELTPMRLSDMVDPYEQDIETAGAVDVEGDELSMITKKWNKFPFEPSSPSSPVCRPSRETLSVLNPSCTRERKKRRCQKPDHSRPKLPRKLTRDVL